MRKKPSRFLLLLPPVVASALVITAAGAFAPPDQYGLFAEGDRIIHDRFTLLDWERRPKSPAVTQAAAATYCGQLAIDSGGPWRLPTYKELLTLVDEKIEIDSMGIATAIDLNAFNYPFDVVAAEYWSSSNAPNGPPLNGDGWTVRFDTGASSTRGISSLNYVRCVRSTP